MSANDFKSVIIITIEKKSVKMNANKCYEYK